MGNKFEKLVEETVVEVAPIVGIAARAIGSAGKAIARSVVGPAPTRNARNAGTRQSLKNRKINAKINRYVQNNTRERDWLKANDSDQAAKIAKETIRNNKGTGGSNVVTSGNKTTNHTSNYNQVRKKDLQVYSATKQGQPPVKDDESDNPLVTNTSASNQGSTSSNNSSKKTAVSGKFRAKVSNSAGVQKPKPTASDDSSTDDTENEKSDFRSRVASNAKSTAQGVTNVLLKHLTPGS